MHSHVQVKLEEVEEEPKLGAEAKHAIDEARAKLSVYEKALEEMTFADTLKEYQKGHEHLKKDANLVEFREEQQAAGAKEDEGAFEL